MTTRKKHTNVTASEWTDFVAAVNAMHGTGVPAPRYRDFVRVHVNAMSPVGMSWGVHTMPEMGMIGRNFLAWHRQMLWQFEKRLQVVKPGLGLPYWDWLAMDNNPPAAISKPALLSSWSVTRSFNPAQMPTSAEVQAAMSASTFPAFQRSLELGAHNAGHLAVGGTMATSSSPADPLFWLHHANIDRLWAEWQAQHAGQDPLNANETLKPPPLFNVKVSSVLNINVLGYQYV